MSPSLQSTAAGKVSKKSRSRKILRACVVQDGRIVEEQRLRRRMPLSIGTAPGNTFAIGSSKLPHSHQLFHLRAGAYELVLTEGMRGKVSLGGGADPLDFSELRAQGQIRKKGQLYYLPLEDNQRGKVIIGDVTLIFQFIVPPPAAPKPRLPAAARGRFRDRIDWPYAIALALAFAFETPAVVGFHFVPRPQTVSLDSLDQRWAKLIVPKREVKKKQAKKPKPKRTNKDKKKKAQAKNAAEKAVKKKKPPRNEAQAAKARAARKAAIKKELAGKGILAILGTVGAGGADGVVADVFGSGLGGDLDAAFDGISGVGIATRGRRRGARGGRVGQAAAIGGLATSGGGVVGLGNKRERVVGTVRTEAPDVDGALDPAAIARVVRARQRMVRDCYERELKRDPDISGKVEIEFTIGASGRVTEALVFDTTMGTDVVGQCIVSRLKKWKFPKPSGGSVTVTFPFVFTASR